MLFLLLPLLIVAPPHRPLVLALQPQIPTSFTLTLSFITLLPSKPAGETAYTSSSINPFKYLATSSKPDRDLLCIFVPLPLASADLGAPVAVTLLFCPLLVAGFGIAHCYQILQET